MIDKLVHKAIRSGVIKEDEFAVYRYAYLLFISWIASVASLLIISGFLGQLFGCIIFLAGYIPLRQFAGGVHLSSMVKCFLVTLAVEIIFMVPILFGYIETAVFFSIMLSIPSNFVILTLAPQESANKPLSERNRMRCKIMSRLLSIVITVASIVLAVFSLKIVAYYFVSSVVLSALGLVVGRIFHPAV